MNVFHLGVQLNGGLAGRGMKPLIALPRVGGVNAVSALIRASDRNVVYSSAPADATN